MHGFWTSYLKFLDPKLNFGVGSAAREAGGSVGLWVELWFLDVAANCVVDSECCEIVTQACFVLLREQGIWLRSLTQQSDAIWRVLTVANLERLLPAAARLCGTRMYAMGTLSGKTRLLHGTLGHVPEMVHLSAQTHRPLTLLELVVSWTYRRGWDCTSWEWSNSCHLAVDNMKPEPLTSQAASRTGRWGLCQIMMSQILAQWAHMPVFKRNTSPGHREKRTKSPPVDWSQFLYSGHPDDVENVSFQFSGSFSSITYWVFVQVFHWESSCFVPHLKF